MRLDELLAGIYERAVGGDIPALDRVLAIGVDRARLLGSDAQTSAGYTDRRRASDNLLDNRRPASLGKSWINARSAIRRSERS